MWQADARTCPLAAPLSASRCPYYLHAGPGGGPAALPLDAVHLPVWAAVGVQLAGTEPHAAAQPEDPLALRARFHGRQPGRRAGRAKQVRPGLGGRRGLGALGNPGLLGAKACNPAALLACACWTCWTDLCLPLCLPGCRGQIRFLRKGPQRCQVKLTISYEVPSAMAPFASVSGGGWGSTDCHTHCLVWHVEGSTLLSSVQTTTAVAPPNPAPPSQLLNPVVEGILQADMVRFKDYAAAHLANTKAA